MKSQLPYKMMKVKTFDFRKDPRCKSFKSVHAVVNYVEDEIWVNTAKATKKPVDTIELSKLHELVHVRRQNNNEDNWLGEYEEDIVELEAIARCPDRHLNQAQKVLKKYLVTQLYKKKKLSPNDLDDLKVIHKKIKSILRYKYKN